MCGDGVQGSTEECDDGNTADGDGCSAVCVSEFCGDGVVNNGEQCDDGNTTAGDGCDSSCVSEFCGDGVVNNGEECDDGNTTDGDGCSAACLTEICGDGVVNNGEECDDGNMVDGDGCTTACVMEFCGDGINNNNGEFCDDGNMTDGDSCDATCTVGITVTTPNGGDVAIAGDMLPITWTSGGVTLVDIEVHRAGMLDSVLVQGVANTGSFSWPVETNRVHAADYTIVVRDASGLVADGSDMPFEVRNWANRSPLTIATTVPQTNFPVAVELDMGTFNYALAAPDGGDLRFATTADRAMGFDLPYYIENWDPMGTSIIWVNVPALDPMNPTTIFMFHGLAGLTTTSDMAGTFANTYVSTGNDVINGDMTVDVFTVQAGHTVTLTAGVPSTITARIITIDGTIDGTAAGHAGGQAGNVGAGPGGGGTSTNSGTGGGGYGGAGGTGGLDAGDTPGAGGAINGDSALPVIDMGSGGGGSTDGVGGVGGGAVALVARRIDVSGSILVDGGAGTTNPSLRSTGGGAGGGILVLGYDVLASGMFSAIGGDGGADTDTNADDGGGGGGGRVKFFPERSISDTAPVDVAGGIGGPQGSGGGGGDGGAGTSTADPMATTDEPTLVIQPPQPVF